MPLERRSVHISGCPAGNVEVLPIGIDQASERGQQPVGGGQIGGPDTGQLPRREAVLTVSCAQADEGDRAAVIIKSNADPLRLKSELDSVPSANISGVVGKVVGVGGAALILKCVYRVAEGQATDEVARELLRAQEIARGQIETAAQFID